MILKLPKEAGVPSISLNHSFGTSYSFVNDLAINGVPVEQDPFNEQFKNNKNFGLGLSLNIPILNGWQVNKNISIQNLTVENSQYCT